MAGERVIDIVCGKDVSPEAIRRVVGQAASGAAETDPTAGTKRFYNGRWYYFCSLACRHRFLATPDEYIEKAGQG